MGKRGEPEQLQEARIENLSRDFIEDLLTGKAALIIEPLDGRVDVGERTEVGQLAVTLLKGFTIRLRPAR